ncbi:MAG: hypothetical protein JNK04_06005 [Myxococcales bacterium]|nr:hypothetical protein [Myxococcales bacterium]
MRPSYRSLCVALPLLAALVPSRAIAAELTAEQVAARRQLIEGAQAARQAGDRQRALDLASRAGQMQMTVSLRRFIAEEQLEVGLPASALGSAELCVREAKLDGLASEHGSACEIIAATAKPRVAFVVITTKTAVPGLRVQVGDQEVPLALLGQRYVVNPGEIVVKATAPAYLPFQARATTVAGSEVSVLLDPQLAPKVAPKNERGFYLSPLLPIGAGVLVASSAVALGFGISGKVDLADYEARCVETAGPSSCRTEQAELQSDLDGRAIAVDVALGFAGAGLVVGAIGAFMTGPTDEQKAAMWQGKILF